MGSGISGLYTGTKGSSEPKTGINYNFAKSKSVKRVALVRNIGEQHSMPIYSTPNSVSQKIRDGKMYEERFYDSAGKAYLDIDYSFHNTPGKHTNPHQHDIIIKNGRIVRGVQEPIK